MLWQVLSAPSDSCTVFSVGWRLSWGLRVIWTAPKRMGQASVPGTLACKAGLSRQWSQVGWVGAGTLQRKEGGGQGLG